MNARPVCSRPLRLVAIIRSHSSGSADSNGAPSMTPAFATTRSAGPSPDRTAPAAASTAARSVTSTGTASPPISAAIASRRSLRRPRTATAAPAAANARAVASPSPLVAPVTTAMRPVRVASVNVVMRPACGGGRSPASSRDDQETGPWESHGHPRCALPAYPRRVTDNRLGEYLRARRELTQPADVGLPDGVGRRRVPGLRREEVAMLAGVSADYYVRLEQGRDKHPSEQVIEALAGVLGLDGDGVAHVRELARPARRRRRAPSRPERVSDGIQSLLDGWTHTPALVLGRRLDVLAVNALGASIASCSVPGVNQVREVFLNPDACELYPDWDVVAAEATASLRAAAGADLDDPALTDLVGELSLKSAEFRRLWARHDVRPKTSGSKRFRHPLVGELTLRYESLAVNGAPGQLIVAYHAAPGSPSEQAIALLSSTITRPAAGKPAADERSRV